MCDSIESNVSIKVPFRPTFVFAVVDDAIWFVRGLLSIGSVPFAANKVGSTFRWFFLDCLYRWMDT